jgi:hypothetical protein
MTIKFLEINYPQDITDIQDGTPPEIIRLTVTNETEARGIYDKLDISIKDRPHTAFLHECNHSAAGNAPCTTKELAKVRK